MRKNFGAKPFMYPQPVLVIGTYNEDNTANAMNAAWGCISDMNQVTLYLSATHKTVVNILRDREFSVSMADEAHVIEADYVGVVSANKEKNKIEKAGLHYQKSEFVNAPIFEEFPLTLECKMISYDKEAECMIGEIINTSAEERILDEQGNIDPTKLKAISFDGANNAYYVVERKVGNAFKDGLRLK